MKNTQDFLNKHAKLDKIRKESIFKTITNWKMNRDMYPEFTKRHMRSLNENSTIVVKIQRRTSSVMVTWVFLQYMHKCLQILSS